MDTRQPVVNLRRLACGLLLAALFGLGEASADTSAISSTTGCCGCTSSTITRGAAASQPCTSSVTRVSAPGTQVAVTVSAVGQAPATNAASAAGIAKAASEPSWAASSAHAADNLRKQRQDLLAIQLERITWVASVLAVGAVFLAMWSALQTYYQGGFGVTSHWGGFGGSTGGWQLSPAVAGFIGAAALALGAAMLGAGALDAARSTIDPAPDPSAAKKAS